MGILPPHRRCDRNGNRSAGDYGLCVGLSFDKTGTGAEPKLV